LQIVKTRNFVRDANVNAVPISILGVNYILVMLLPFVFFERCDRTLNATWWMTAAPFILLPVLAALTLAGVPPRLPAAESRVGETLAQVSILLSAASIRLVLAALAVHRRPPAQWHQRHDAPSELVTAGPYARLRHPFYLAYLLMFGAFTACLPGPGTFAVLAYAGAALNFTAAREERLLMCSSFGHEYRAYAARTGRFLPALSRSPR
jgi:protein-S-isoprenylcysteine O-methyltransferase Ste14